MVVVQTWVGGHTFHSVAEILVGQGGDRPPPFTENAEVKNRLFECKWEGFVGNLKVLSEI
jgi:hypothetical protein